MYVVYVFCCCLWNLNLLKNGSPSLLCSCLILLNFSCIHWFLHEFQTDAIVSHQRTCSIVLFLFMLYAWVVCERDFSNQFLFCSQLVETREIIYTAIFRKGFFYLQHDDFYQQIFISSYFFLFKFKISVVRHSRSSPISSFVSWLHFWVLDFKFFLHFFGGLQCYFLSIHHYRNFMYLFCWNVLWVRADTLNLGFQPFRLEVLLVGIFVRIIIVLVRLTFTLYIVVVWVLGGELTSECYLIDAGVVVWTRRARRRLKRIVLRWIILRIIIETRRDGSRSWHAIRRCSESLTASLSPLAEALIDQFVFAHWIDAPEAALARFILRTRDFDKITVQAQVVTNAVLPSFVRSCTIVGIIFGNVGIDSG